MFKSLFSWAKKKYQNIEPETLHQRIEANNAGVILDVRSEIEFGYHGHTPQAVCVPLDTLADYVASFEKETPITCIDRAGRRSEQACQQLAELGFTNLFNVAGGIQAWKKAGYPLEREKI